MKKTISQQAIVELLRGEAPRALRPNEICKLLGIHPRNHDRVADKLAVLLSQKKVRMLPGNRYLLKEPMARSIRVTQGVLSGHAKGFGFVSALDGKGDIFIPPGQVRNALHGDKVEVEWHPSRKGREGSVIRVLERRTKFVTGTVHRSAGNEWLIPDDPRLRGPMYLVERAPQQAHSRDTCVRAELVHYPDNADELPEARVVDILGFHGSAEIEVRKIRLREGIEEEFPESVLEEASHFGARVPEKDKAQREDLRHLPFTTIDPPDARDHDDALFAEETKDGFRIVVAIADVAHYVRPETEIDGEALRRGCSVYLPDRAIPMLPRELSTHLASLVPNEDRLAMIVDMTIGRRGKLLDYELYEGVIRSRAKLDYGSVAHALGMTKTPGVASVHEDFMPILQTLRKAATVLRQKRTRRGSFDFEIPEARFEIDDETYEPLRIYQSRTDPGLREAYRIVEEMMLAANEAVAEYFTNAELPCIYRTHGLPDADKLVNFVKMAQSMGNLIDMEKAQNPKHLSRFVRDIPEDAPQRDAMQYLLLRAMQQAIYSPDPTIGHFGLAATHYLHFTSPIRRYPDLIVHRLLKDVLWERGVQHETEELGAFSSEASRLERRAMGAEREVQSVYKTLYMRDRIGETYRARISGISQEKGIFATIEDPFVDVTIPFDILPNDNYEADEFGLHLFGRFTGIHFSIGDFVEIEVVSINLDRRQVIAEPLDLRSHIDERAKRNAERRERLGRDRKSRGRGHKKSFKYQEEDARPQGRRRPSGKSDKRKSKKKSSGSGSRRTPLKANSRSFASPSKQSRRKSSNAQSAGKSGGKRHKSSRKRK